MKSLLKSPGQIECAKVPNCLSWNQGFFITHLFGGQLFPIPYTFLARQSYFRQPNQKSFEQKNEVTFYGRLANVRASVVRGLHCPSSQNQIKKALHEITINSQG